MSIKFEVCCNAEWLEVFGGVITDADDYADNIMLALSAAFPGADIRPPRGQRATCHGWHGANLFAHKIGPIGTFDDLTAEQVATAEKIAST